MAIMYYQGWRGGVSNGPGVWRYALVTPVPSPQWAWKPNECLWLIPGTGWEEYL